MTFNLVKEPWLPCLMPNGSLQFLSLRDTLLRAGDIRELRDESPLTTAALHRFLLAILHRIYGPKDHDAWHELWAASQFVATKLDQYFSQWKDRFDLFDKKHPFYQTANFTTKAPSGINRLSQALSRGNNATLFDHTDDGDPPAITSGQATRWIITEQAYAIGGGKSATGNTTHAPLVGAAMLLPLGRNLRETLLLNMVNYNGKDSPFPSKGDLPCWEKDTNTALESQSSVPTGYLDLLTWQTRTLRLLAEETNGQPMVRQVYYAQGRQLESSLHDPAFAYWKNDKAPAKQDRAILPVRFSEYKALWRDSTALLRHSSNGNTELGSGILSAMSERKGWFDLKSSWKLAVIGLCTDKAKVNFWRHEILPLPVEYLTDPNLLTNIQSAVEMAEAASYVLKKSVAIVSRNLLSPADPNNADGDRVSKMADAFGAMDIYWSRLESAFHSFLTELPGNLDHRQKTLADWFNQTLRPNAWEAFNHTAGGLRSSARDDQAVVRGEECLHKGLGIIAKDFSINSSDRPSLAVEVANV